VNGTVDIMYAEHVTAIYAARDFRDRSRGPVQPRQHGATTSLRKVSQNAIGAALV